MRNPNSNGSGPARAAGRRKDSRAATIFKSPRLRGESTFIPANAWCTDVSNIFGGFDGQVRSLSVEKGCVCRFYQEAGCNVNDFTGGGKVLEVGFKSKRDERKWLGSWEEKVASVFCERLV
ncbi:hypothetical protein SVAN01_10320 [Stagonosporopsis vannaccii]|nr:hypothetical protein SVAN01_10320 [Stagonosporopsis vannaccii]